MKKLWQQEKGSSLVIAILVLVALTIIGLSALTSSHIATDVSSNLKVRAEAYHAAEACLYYQIRRIKTSGSATTALNQTLGNGISCTATAPAASGGGGGTGILDGYSLEEGSEGISYASYAFDVTGVGPRNSTSTISVIINLPAAGGGY